MIFSHASLLIAMGLGCWQDATPEDVEVPDPLTVACQEFERSSPDARAQVIADIDAKVAACEDDRVRDLVALVERARRELKVLPAQKPGIHHADEYAPAQPDRRLHPSGHPASAEMIGRFERYGAEPIFARRVRYDYARNVGVDSGVELDAGDRLYNYLFGYPDGVDVLVAWMEARLDHDDSLDPVALHFSRLYSDLNGNCAEGVLLYDAFASFAGVDMPDVDVIAYARNVLKDDSYVSPIPPGRRQSQLFERVHLDFLKYFRHRTLVEYTANLFLNPEAPLDYAHEALRERILYGFHLDEMNLQKVRARLIGTGTRGRFIDQVDTATTEDPYWRWYAKQVGYRRNDTRWVIALLAHDALRENGFLRDAAVTEVASGETANGTTVATDVGTSDEETPGEVDPDADAGGGEPGDTQRT